MEVQTITIPFAERQDSGPHVIRTNAHFRQPVRKVAVALSGYTARFTEGDHHLQLLTVKVDATILPGPVNEPDFGEVWPVELTATLGLRDEEGWILSSAWDDPYAGEITCCVMAELGRDFPFDDDRPPVPPIFEG